MIFGDRILLECLEEDNYDNDYIGWMIIESLIDYVFYFGSNYCYNYDIIIMLNISIIIYLHIE